MEAAFGELQQKWSSGIDGQQLVFVDENVVAFIIGPNIKIVDLTSGSESTIACGGVGVGCIAGSGSGLIAYAEEEGSILVQNVEGQLVHKIEDGADRLRYRALAFANNGEWLLTVDDAKVNEVAIWDISEESPVKFVSDNIELPVDAAVVICSNPNNHYELAIMTTFQLLMFEIEQCGHLYHISHSPVHLMKRKRRASLNRRSSVSEILDLDKFVNKTKPVELTCVAWAQTGHLYIGTKESTILQVEAGERVSQVVKTLEDGGIRCMGCAGLELVVSGDATKIARWLDTTTADLQEVEVKDLDGVPISMCCSNGGQLALAGASYGVVLTKQRERSFIDSLTGTTVGVTIVRSLSSEFAVVVNEDGVGRVHNVASGALKSNIDLGMGVTCVASSNSASMVVVGSDDGRIKIVEVTDNADRVIYAAKVHDEAVSHAAVHPTGKCFASVGGGVLALTTILPSLTTVAVLNVEGEVVDMTINHTVTQGSSVEVYLLVRSKQGMQLVVAVFTGDSAGLVKDRVVGKTVGVDFDAVTVTACSGQLYLQELMGDIVVVDGSNIGDSIKADSSLAIVAGHVYSSGCGVTTALSGKMIASVGSDGVLMARLAHGVDEASCVEPYGKKVHRFSQEKIDKPRCYIAAVANGSMFVTSDAASVFAWEWATDAKGDLAKQVGALDESVIQEANDVATAVAGFAETDGDGQGEIAAVTRLINQELQTSQSKGASFRDTLLADCTKLKEQFQQLAEANTSKPELEKLSAEEFQLDLAEKERLDEEGKTQMHQLKADIGLQILIQQFLRHRVKKQCWDSMETKGKAVYTFDGKLEVSNYPLRIRTKEELAELKKIQIARSIENEFAKKKIQLSRSNDGGGDDFDFEEEDEVSEFYNHQHLHSSVKKRAQVVLLKDYIHRIKQKFNEQFEDVWSNKKTDMKKIFDKNKLIVAVCDELKLGGIECDPSLFFPETRTLEEPEELLVVKPEEVTVEHILNATEREEKTKQDAIDAEKARLAAMDNPIERGLIDMMDGSLAGRDQNELWNPLAPPAFMETVSEENQTDMQKHKIQEWHDRVAEQEETRGKRIKALNTEQITLKGSVESTKNSFDGQVKACFNKKIEVEQELIQQELKILLLLRSLQTEADFLDNEEKLSRERVQVMTHRSQREAAVEEAEQVVIEYKQNVVAKEKASKAVEKSFKARFLRECPEAEELIDLLAKMFRKKPGKKAQVEERPEGLSDTAWERYQELKAHKHEDDKELAVLQAALATRESYYKNRKKEATEGMEKANELLDNLRECREKRFVSALNVEVLIPIKQGLVEVHHTNDFEPEFHTAVLIPRKSVMELNEKIIELGKHKVEHMEASMTLRRKTHSLKWEHRRLDRLRDDLITQTREVQMLRVTKNMQLDGASSSQERNRKENETLEKTIQQLEHVMESSIATKKKQIASIDRKMKSFKTQNVKLQPQMEELAIDVEEHSMLNTVFNINRGANKANELVKAAAAKRRMVNAIKMQEDEIHVLRDEVERMRRKTFPGFAQGQRAAF